MNGKDKTPYFFNSEDDNEQEIERKVNEILGQIPSLEIPELFKGERVYIFQFRSGEDGGVKLSRETETKALLKQVLSNPDKRKRIQTAPQFSLFMMEQLGKAETNKWSLEIMNISANPHSGIAISVFDSADWLHKVIKYDDSFIRLGRMIAHPSTVNEKILFELFKKSINDFSWKLDDSFENGLSRIIIMKANKLAYEKQLDLKTVINNAKEYVDFWEHIKGEILEEFPHIQNYQIIGFDERGFPLLTDVERNYFVVTVHTPFDQVTQGEKATGFSQIFLKDLFMRAFSRKGNDETIVEPEINREYFSSSSLMRFGQCFFVLKIEKAEE